jgi:hypothetical protein
MKYEQIIETVSAIVEDERIYKKGLMLIYKLDNKNHREMSEYLFYKANPTADMFTPTEEFEITLGGILVKFIKENPA